jgi:hypothetical protein
VIAPSLGGIPHFDVRWQFVEIWPQSLFATSTCIPQCFSQFPWCKYVSPCLDLKFCGLFNNIRNMYILCPCGVLKAVGYGTDLKIHLVPNIPHYPAEFPSMYISHASLILYLNPTLHSPDPSWIWIYVKLYNICVFSRVCVLCFSRVSWLVLCLPLFPGLLRACVSDLVL